MQYSAGPKRGLKPATTYLIGQDLSLAMRMRLKTTPERVDNQTGAESILSAPRKFADMPARARIAISLFGAIGAIELLVALWHGPSAGGGVFFLMVGLAGIN